MYQYFRQDPVGSNLVSALLIWVVTGLYSYIIKPPPESSFRTIVYWLFENRISYFSILVIIIIIFVIHSIIHFVRNKYQWSYNEAQAEKDRNLFQHITSELLPSNGAIRFIRTHDFGGSHDYNSLDDLGRYANEITLPEFEFIHQGIQEKLIILNNLIPEFLSYVALNTHSLNHPVNDLYSISKNLQEDDYESFRELQQAMNHMADGVVIAYDDLVKYGRRMT